MAAPGGRWERRALLLLAWATGSGQLAASQTFDFDDVQTPGANALQMHYLFYVYGARGDQAPTVKFDTVVRPRAKDPSAPSAGEVEKYQGLQVALMPHKHIWSLIDVDNFCTEGVNGTAGHFSLKNETSEGVVIHTISGDRKDAQTATLAEPGIYALVFTNCGYMRGISVEGSVSVMNPSGYLPAIEERKMNMYAALAAFYTLSAFLWLVLALRWWKQLYYVQKGIAMINLMGVFECIAWWLLYYRWNTTGEYSHVLFLVGALASVWKVMSAFRLVFVSALSADPEKADEDDVGVGLYVHGALMVYMVAEFNFRTVLSYRYSHALKLSFVLINAAPAVLMSGVLFLWSHSAMMDLMTKLRERKEEKQLSLFGRTQAVMILATMGAAVVVAVQIFDPTASDDTSQWGYHFLVSDGLFQGVFALILVASMLIWVPTETTQGYEYAAQSQGGDVIGAPAGVIWDDDDLEEDKKHADDDKPFE